ncbi:MAG: N-6 DNA methylase, partial [Anaerolineae bacterium]|nr:N-6 DNA methylase [Anaerolineae bacterium]
MNPVNAYVNDLRSMYGSGVATEHSYRSSLEGLLRSFDESLQVINEPRQLDFGAPDLVLQLAGQPVGYVECKDLRVALDAVENSDQLNRYRVACDNLILTNYREFRWYRGGEEVGQTVTVARLTGSGLQAQRRQYSDLTSLLERFQRTSPADITSPEDLARVMADLTREIADLISETLNTPNLRSFLHKHKHDLEFELLPELDNSEFADMYAQTLAYALFAARMELQHLPARDFTLARAFADMPRTNRFLHREFGQIFQELEREVKWAVEQLTTRLANTQISDVMRDFGSGTRQRDAIVHFYEDFLATHDPVLREQRGVYFTPEPVVGYIVRSVDTILRSHFDRRDGLASDDVHILDPATGTGSFLLAVVELIYETMRGQRGIWPDYVRRQLLPRLHGFELLMAPYTLAHMRMGLFLSENGCPPGEDDRLNILLTNSLDRGEKKVEQLWEDHIVAEANAAAEVKNDKPIMVVLGNPPYSGHSANKGHWIRELMRNYYFVDGVPLKERNPKWLQDDYVKFIRFGQWRIERNGEGVLAFITNHAWLDNPTFRGMRQSLLNSFSEIYVLDLHGNSKKKETTPDGNRDDNVFDIQQGVSVAFFIRHKDHNGPARVFHSDCQGLRKDKYTWLNTHNVEDTDWQEIFPQSPSYFFVPFDYEGWREYEKGWKVT